MSQANDKYSQRGVSAGKEEVHAAISGLDKGLYPDAFCKVLPDLVGGDAAWCNIMHADTAGTKTILAYLYWRETGDLSVWAGIVQDAIVMNTDDMAAAGVKNNILLSSTIGRNKNRIPGEVLTALIEGTTAFIEQMAALGVQLHLTGGETADVGDVVRTCDVGFTAFARMPRAQVQRVQPQPGDVIVALASDGQCSYETRYNSGIGSNGLTYARHELLSKHYAEAYPESFDPALAAEVVYSGNCRLTNPVAGTTQNVGQLLLSPTRTYLPFLNSIPDALRPYVHGIVHCTGGAQTKVLHFVNDLHIIKDNLFPVPPLFALIQAQTGAAWTELYKVLNMGQRLELYVHPSSADELLALAAHWQIGARVIGRVEAMPGARRVSLTLPAQAGGAIIMYEQ